MNDFFASILDHVSRLLESLYGRKKLFVLLVFDQGSEHMHYITNAGNLEATHKMRVAADRVDPERNFPHAIGSA